MPLVAPPDSCSTNNAIRMVLHQMFAGRGGHVTAAYILLVAFMEAKQLVTCCAAKFIGGNRIDTNMSVV